MTKKNVIARVNQEQKNIIKGYIKYEKDCTSKFIKNTINKNITNKYIYISSFNIYLKIIRGENIWGTVTVGEFIDNMYQYDRNDGNAITYIEKEWLKDISNKFNNSDKVPKLLKDITLNNIPNRLDYKWIITNYELWDKYMKDIFKSTYSSYNWVKFKEKIEEDILKNI